MSVGTLQSTRRFFVRFVRMKEEDGLFADYIHKECVLALTYFIIIIGVVENFASRRKGSLSRSEHAASDQIKFLFQIPEISFACYPPPDNFAYFIVHPNVFVAKYSRDFLYSAKGFPSTDARSGLLLVPRGGFQ